MNQLTANDLKVRGVSAIEEVLAAQSEATISVRGKDRFVVMDVAHYHYLRECELEAALAQSKADLTAGRSVAESAAAHHAAHGAGAGTSPDRLTGRHACHINWSSSTATTAAPCAFSSATRS